MGSYGVGVSRAVAAIAEGNYDELGLCWPREISPGRRPRRRDRQGRRGLPQGAEEIVRELEARGLEVLYDDRQQVSPGVKFKDSELIGVPTIVVVGRGWRTASSRSRTGVRASAATSRSTRRVAEVGREVRGTGHPAT